MGACWGWWMLHAVKREWGSGVNLNRRDTAAMQGGTANDRGQRNINTQPCTERSWYLLCLHCHLHPITVKHTGREAERRGRPASVGIMEMVCKV